MQNKLLIQSFTEYCVRHHKNDLIGILKEPLASQSFSVCVDFFTLFEEEIELGSSLLTDPAGTLSQFDQGLVQAQQRILKENNPSTSLSDSLVYSDVDSGISLAGWSNPVVGTVLSSERISLDGGSVKPLVHTRITGLPANVKDDNKKAFPDNDDLGLFVQISGNVVRVTLPCLQEYERTYLCSKCGTTQATHAEYELDNALLPPFKCISGCANPKFTHVKEEGKERLKDYQEVRIQEDLGKLHLGSVPSSIWVTLDHDLVSVCHPGEHVTIWGTVMRRWKSWKNGMQSDVEIVLKGNNVQVTNHQRQAKLVTHAVREKIRDFWAKYSHNPLQARDIILASFCPDMYGVYVAKLALCVALCGGTECEDARVRAQPHVLLVGDPGTGKSHLLRFAARVASRSVITTGVGSTTAGLTVCAVREGSDWQLEAGALVLADGGVCCIDELNTMKEHDRASLHEAMEQQTISVAKAGMVSKLSTKCTVLAATNAKQGGYNPAESLSTNTSLGSPLLSRFDLVLVMRDTRNDEWDSMLSSFILGLAVAPSSEGSTELWSAEDIQLYLAYCRTFSPKIGAAAHMVLTTYYQLQRSADNRSAARTTVRMLESMIRLSQGHARLMLRNLVTTEDAVITVTLMECSMGTCALTGTADALRAPFPDNPMQLYRQQATILLKKLQLEDILEAELQRLDELEGKEPEERSPAPAPGPLLRPPDHALSQRITNIMTDIRRKKDRETCQAAGMTNRPMIKRKRPTVNRNKKAEEGATSATTSVKKKRRIILCDSESEEETTGEKIADVESADTDADAQQNKSVESVDQRFGHSSVADATDSGNEGSLNTEHFGNNSVEKSKTSWATRRRSRQKSLDFTLNMDDLKRSKRQDSALDKLQKFKCPPSVPSPEKLPEVGATISRVEQENINPASQVEASFKAVQTSTPLRIRRTSEIRHPRTKTFPDAAENAAPSLLAQVDKSKEDKEQRDAEVEKINVLIWKSKQLSQTSQRWSQVHTQQSQSPQSQQQSQFNLDDVTWDNFPE